MVQCPSCRSYNEPEASFCNQCGVSLEEQDRPQRRGTSRPRLRIFSALLVLAALVVVIVIGYAPDPVKRDPSGGSFSPWGRKRPRPSTVTQGSETGAAYSIEPLPGEDLEDDPLDLAGVTLAVQPALVVLDLRGEDGRPLRETLGVIVDSAGVVLTRFRPLLGAHRGTCRLFTPREPRVEILGVSYSSPELDVALVRIARSPVSYPMVNLLPEPPEQVLQVNDPLFVFTGHRGMETALANGYHASPDGYSRLRLADTPVVPPDGFLVVDAYGFAVGLCRFETNGRLLSSLKSPGTGQYRVLVDSVTPLTRSLSSDVGWRLPEITRTYYEGTFADLFLKGSLAYRQGRWKEAIDHFEGALERVPLDGPDEEDVSRASGWLRESYLEEVRRLVSAQRMQEAALIVELAAARYEDDAVLLVLLGEARYFQKNWSAGIDALARAREIEPTDRVDSLLEEGFLELAGESATVQDLQGQEASLLEGIEMLPSSGNLRLQLAKLYVTFEAYDEAIRLLQDVRVLSPQLRGAADGILARIDDILKRREAVIIPIAPGSRSIRTQATVEGRVGTLTLAFVIDTGATYTTIPSRVASDLGYGAGGKPINVKTAGGIVGGRLIQVRSLDVGGYAVRNLEVLVLPSSIAPEFGLLGLNYLNYFKYSVDSVRKEFRMERQ